MNKMKNNTKYIIGILLAIGALVLAYPYISYLALGDVGTVYTAIQGYQLNADGSVASSPIGTITVTGTSFSQSFNTNPYNTGLLNAGTVSYTHLTLPTILRV